MWRPIPAIDALVGELDRRYPKRVKPDWIIGDADHSARASDHNPEDPDPGEGAWREVHAIDIRLGGDVNVRELLEALIGDKRVAYVIHDGKIYSRTYGWEARVYTGSNPHRTHVHASFRYGEEFERDTSAFFDPVKTRTRPVPIDLSVVRGEFKKALGLEPGPVQASPHVKRLQRALREQGLYNGEIDGIVGQATLRGWGQWERRRDVDGRGRVRMPDRRSLAALIAPRWRMVA